MKNISILECVKSVQSAKHKFSFIFLTLSILSILYGCADDLTESNVFTLSTVPDLLPTSDTWIITDSGKPRTTEFNILEEVLRDLKDRKINLEFPNIEEIPANAFFDIITLKGGSSIFSISAEKATIIGESAFHTNTGLTTINLPSAININRFAFSKCGSLTFINLPNVTTLGDFAFYDCTTLSTVDIPKATIIGSHAFVLCIALTNITIATESQLSDFSTNVFMGVAVAKVMVTTHNSNVNLFVGTYGFMAENINKHF